MKRESFKLYILQTSLLIILILLALFIKKMHLRIILAILLSLYAILTKFLLKKNILLDVRAKKIIKIIVLLGILYVVLFYTLGIYTGFYVSTHIFNLANLINYIVPIIAIIIASEYIRYKFISYETNLSKILNFIVMLLIEVCLFINLYGFNNLDRALITLGYVIFAGIAGNLLYNFISKKFGCKPVIYYRLITVLYPYVIPVTPDVYIFLRTFFKMLYPLIVYYVILDNYSTCKNAIIDKKNKRTVIASACSFFVMTLFIMLISCQFRFGALVVGSSSMSDYINKGDVIIYNAESTKNLKIGDVIVFNRDSIKIVHRIVNIKKLNDEFAYYTKGDNNTTQDEGHVNESDIYGKVVASIPKIGMPTLYLHDVFNKSKEGAWKWKMER